MSAAGLSMLKTPPKTKLVRKTDHTAHHQLGTTTTLNLLSSLPLAIFAKADPILPMNPPAAVTVPTTTLHINLNVRVFILSSELKNWCEMPPAVTEIA
jgi:hypothetical protein